MDAGCLTVEEPRYGYLSLRQRSRCCRMGAARAFSPAQPSGQTATDLSVAAHRRSSLLSAAHRSPVSAAASLVSTSPCRLLPLCPVSLSPHLLALDPSSFSIVTSSLSSSFPHPSSSFIFILSFYTTHILLSHTYSARDLMNRPYPDPPNALRSTEFGDIDRLVPVQTCGHRLQQGLQERSMNGRSLSFAHFHVPPRHRTHCGRKAISNHKTWLVDMVISSIPFNRVTFCCSIKKHVEPGQGNGRSRDSTSGHELRNHCFSRKDHEPWMSLSKLSP